MTTPPRVLYKAFTEPVSQDQEAPHPEAFWRQTEVPVWDVPRAVDEGGMAWNDNIGRDEEPHPDAFWRQTEVPVWDVPRPVDEGHFVIDLIGRAEDPHVDAFWRQTEVSVWDVPRPIDEGSFVMDLIGRDEEPHPDAFIFQMPDPVIAEERRFDEGALPPTQDTAPVLADFGWYAPASEPTAPVPAVLEGYYAMDLIGRDEEVHADAFVTLWLPVPRDVDAVQGEGVLPPRVDEAPAGLADFGWYIPASEPVLSLEPFRDGFFAMDLIGRAEEAHVDAFTTIWIPIPRDVEPRPDGDGVLPPSQIADPLAEFGWWMPPSEPVRILPGLLDEGEFEGIVEPHLYFLPNLEWYQPTSEPVRLRGLLRVGPMEWRSYEFLILGVPGRIVFRDEAAMIQFGESSASVQTLDTVATGSLFWDDAAVVALVDDAGSIGFGDEVTGY